MGSLVYSNLAIINGGRMGQIDNPLPSTDTTGLYDGKTLVITSATSVQPNVMLRTGVFTPVGRTTDATEVKTLDLSADLISLDLCQTEGYDHVQMRGPRLNIETDFRVWCGIVFVFATQGYSANTVKLPFSEFARKCGYPSRRFDANLRRQIGDSLARIQGQKMSFRRKSAEKAVHTGMLLRAMYDGEEDVVELMADETLWDLYRLDHQVLVSLQILKMLPRAEVAQTLYLFFSSLPNNPVPVSFERLRERVRLETSDKEANRKIKQGIMKLQAIGYLSGSFLTKNRQQYYIVHGRVKQLAVPVGVVPVDVEPVDLD